MPRRRKRSRLPLICGCTIALLVGLQVGFHGDAAPPAAPSAAAPAPAEPLPRPRSLAELREAATSLERKLEGLAAREAGVARQEADAARKLSGKSDAELRAMSEAQAQAQAERERAQRLQLDDEIVSAEARGRHYKRARGHA